MTFHVKGLLAFVALAASLMIAAEPRLGIPALVAWVTIEALSWCGVAGFGRGHHSNHPCA
jgi:hypothetical protein